MPKRVALILNPVETDIFFDRHEHVPGTAIHHSAFCDKEAQEVADRHGLKLRIWNRYAEPVQHSQMPRLFAPYEYYLDIKRSPFVTGDDIVTARSRTAFEALACGLKVLTYDGQLLEGLPPECRPEYAVGQYYQHYRRMKGGFWSEGKP
jgi:hypothetical protein